MIEIKENSLLLRRYYTPFSKYMNEDGTPTSRVFKPRTKDDGKLSVNLKSYTTYEKTIGEENRFFISEVSNAVVIEIKLTTEHDPLEDNSNEAHALISPFDEDDDIKPGQLARAARIIKCQKDY